MTLPSFAQIWIAFKTFSSKSILKVGNGLRFIFSLIASIILGYCFYIFYEIPIRDVQVYVHKVYGLNNPYNVNLSLNMDYGRGVTSKYKNDFKKGVILDLSNSYQWDHKDSSVFSMCSQYFYTQGNHIYREFDYPVLNVLRTLQNEITLDSGIVRVLFAAHIVESKMSHIKYNPVGEEIGHYSGRTLYQRDLKTDSIVRYKVSYQQFTTEGIDQVSKHNSIMATCYIANTDPSVSFSKELPATYALSSINILSPFDISQCYYHLTLDISNNSNKSSLKLDFGGATDFSHMDPEPDKTTMSSVVFTDSVKLRKIGLNGLWMHTKFKQLENIQIIRMFVITTALGFFIAILFSSGWKWLLVRSRRYSIKEKRKNSKDLEE